MKNYFLLLTLLLIAVTYSCKKDETSGSGSGGGDSQMIMKVTGDTVNNTYTIHEGEYETWHSVSYGITLKDTVEDSDIYFSVRDSTFPSIRYYSHLEQDNLYADLTLNSSSYSAHYLDTISESSVTITLSENIYTIEGTFYFLDFDGSKSKVKIDYSGVLSESEPY